MCMNASAGGSDMGRIDVLRVPRAEHVEFVVMTLLRRSLSEAFVQRDPDRGSRIALEVGDLRAYARAEA